MAQLEVLVEVAQVRQAGALTVVTGGGLWDGGLGRVGRLAVGLHDRDDASVL